MSRLTAILVRLLRYLSSLFGTSIRRLLALLNFIRWRISITKAKSSNVHDDPPLPPPPESILLRSNEEYVCPSHIPRGGHLTLDVSHDVPGHDHDGPYTTTVHSPSPTRTSFSGNLYAGSQSSRSSRAISFEEGSDTRSVNSHLSVGRQANGSTISLPLSTHGLQMLTAGPATPTSQRSASPFSQRPASRISEQSGSQEPIKVSRAPTPNRPSTPPLRTADPTGETPSRSSSPETSILVLPMSTSTIRRWNRGIKISTEYNHCLVDPFKFTYQDDEPPAGWAPCTHPEGALYFYHKEKRIYTDALMYDPTQAEIINETADQLLGRLQAEALNSDVKAVLPKEYDLALEIVDLGENGLAVGYYFADHDSKLLFWMDEFDASTICGEIACVVSIAHLRLEIESQYWTHYELFPNSRDYTEKVLDEVKGILLHATVDSLTSRTSTALWTMEQNKTMLNIINHLDVQSTADRIWAGSVIGRVMRNLKHTQFIHLYGQHGARLDRDKSIHGLTVHPHSWYMGIIEPFLFWGAEVHLKALEKIWIDRTVHIEPWKQFIDKLNTEWQDFIIVATVLLNANMAFLSIQSVDTNGEKTPDRSSAQIASYISIVTSLGSVILSLLLVRQNRSKGREAADQAARFLGNMTHGTRGLEHLSILYALPYALLMWSTLTFLAAFALDCFVDASVATRVPVGSVLGVCTILVVWCILAAWICESDSPHMLGQTKILLQERARSLVAMFMGSHRSQEEIKHDDDEPGGDEKKNSQESTTVCATPVEEKQKKRSLSWRFFVRGATTDDSRKSTPEISEVV